MSLLPMRSLSDSLPVLFIEARLQGPPEIVFSQMGISFDTDKCNVALLVRTSGVLLVASVGSYMMYRVCTRLLGRNFIWTILEQARFDLLPRNEAYLLNPKMSYMTNNDYENNRCSEELTNDKESDNLYARYKNQIISTVPSSHHLRGIKKFRKNSIGISRRPSEGTSDNTKHSVSIESQNFSNMGFTSSEKSASLHLLWDDPEWDEETDLCFYGAAAHLDHHSLSSNVSDMTEFRAARFLFEESDDLSKIDRDDQRNCENSRREERIIDLDTSDFIQKNCMTDSKHLYQITAGFTTRTNSMSVSSEHSSQSFLSLRQRLIANASSGGLLELVQSSTALPSTSADHLITSMTDSGISRGTVSTSNLQSTDPKCFFGHGAEDEAVGLGMAITMCKRNSVIGRANLNLISEDHCSATASTRSMEWFEDDYSSYENQDLIREPFQMEIDDPLSACFSHSSCNQVRSSSSKDRRKYLYSITRDLMAWAREQFAPKSSHLKALQALYMSQRWRRIGLKRSSNSSEQFLYSLLHVMLIHGIPFFSCSDALVIEKAVRQTFSRYEFIRQWDFFNESVNVENREEHAISVLQNLWDVQQGIQSMEEEMVERHCMEAVRLLVSLWIVHCFEKTEGACWQHFPNFYAELFGNSNPRQIIQSLCKAQLNNVDMVLLTDALRIRLELLDCSCNGVDVEQSELPRSFVPEDTEKEISARPTLTFLKFNSQNFLYPLYHNLK